jgi:hypothetical protein
VRSRAPPAVSDADLCGTAGRDVTAAADRRKLTVQLSVACCHCSRHLPEHTANVSRARVWHARVDAPSSCLRRCHIRAHPSIHSIPPHNTTLAHRYCCNSSGAPVGLLTLRCAAGTPTRRSLCASSFRTPPMRSVSDAVPFVVKQCWHSWQGWLGLLSTQPQLIAVCSCAAMVALMPNDPMASQSLHARRSASGSAAVQPKL